MKRLLYSPIPDLRSNQISEYGMWDDALQSQLKEFISVWISVEDKTYRPTKHNEWMNQKVLCIQKVGTRRFNLAISEQGEMCCQNLVEDRVECDQTWCHYPKWSVSRHYCIMSELTHGVEWCHNLCQHCQHCSSQSSPMITISTSSQISRTQHFHSK